MYAARVSASLRDPTFLILVALSDEERHGYAIISEVEKISSGRVRLGPGTLYGSLDRLSEQGLIRSTRTEVVEGRHRRYYAITDQGLSAAHEESARRSDLLRATRSRLRPRPT